MAMRGRSAEWASRQSIWKSRAMGAKRSENWARSKSKSAGSNSTRVRKRLDSSSPCSSLNRMLPLWRKMNSAIEATTPLRSGQETRRMAEGGEEGGGGVKKKYCGFFPAPLLSSVSPVVKGLPDHSGHRGPQRKN